MSTILHKQLTAKQALEYIAHTVFIRDLPEDFDGKITCELNDDGSVEVYAVPNDDPEDVLN